MARVDPDDYRERLLGERLAALLGFEWVTDRFPRDVYPPYLLVVTALAVQYGVVDTYNVFVSGHSTVLDDPFSVFSGIVKILDVAGSWWMRDQYAEAVADLRPSERGDNGTSVPGDVGSVPEAFQTIVSLRVKLAFLAIGFAAYFGNAFVRLGVDTIFEIHGVLGGILQDFVVMPIVYVPAMIEFGVLYLGIHVGLPRSLAAADLDLFFYDPRDMGGFAPASASWSSAGTIC